MPLIVCLLAIYFMFKLGLGSVATAIGFIILILLIVAFLGAFFHE